MKKQKVLFLMGGRSGEHEVSIVSAKAVIRNLDLERYEAIEVGITNDGNWVMREDLEKMKEGELIRTDCKERRSAFPTEVLFSKEKKNNKHVLLKITDGKVVKEILFDIAFPVLHGTYGEDGTIQGLFEMYNIPYVGPDLTSAVIGIDKVLFKKIMDREGLPNTPFRHYHRSTFNIDTVKKEISKFGYPLFVKPSNTGSSLGISKVKKEEELQSAVDEAFLFHDKILIEKAIPNAREIEVSAIGNEVVEVSIPGEVFPGDEFYSYNDKYINDKAYTKIPAELPDEKLIEIRTLAETAYRVIDCKGMARVDFLVDGDTEELFISEVNTIPGFTSISMYPKLWEASGLSFKDLVSRLIELGFERYGEKCKNVLSIDSELLRK